MEKKDIVSAYIKIRQIDNTFPEDYSFCNNKPHYITGMSVPPIMTAQIATEIYSQWLSKH